MCFSSHFSTWCSLVTHRISANEWSHGPKLHSHVIYHSQDFCKWMESWTKITQSCCLSLTGFLQMNGVMDQNDSNVVYHSQDFCKWMESWTKITQSCCLSLTGFLQMNGVMDQNYSHVVYHSQDFCKWMESWTKITQSSCLSLTGFLQMNGVMDQNYSHVVYHSQDFCKWMESWTKITQSCCLSLTGFLQMNGVMDQNYTVMLSITHRISANEWSHGPKLHSHVVYHSQDFYKWMESWTKITQSCCLSLTGFLHMNGVMDQNYTDMLSISHRISANEWSRLPKLHSHIVYHSQDFCKWMESMDQNYTVMLSITHRISANEWCHGPKLHRHVVYHSQDFCKWMESWTKITQSCCLSLTGFLQMNGVMDQNYTVMLSITHRISAHEWSHGPKLHSHVVYHSQDFCKWMESWTKITQSCCLSLTGFLQMNGVVDQNYTVMLSIYG